MVAYDSWIERIRWFFVSMVFVLTPSVLSQNQPRDAITNRTSIIATTQRREEIVTDLKVRIITRRERGAGTDNAVYFDIGPLAWKLNHPLREDFEAGYDDTYSLKVPEGFTKDDILWLRLHKKGLGGVTGTRDGFDGAWHPKRLTLIVNGSEFKTVRVDSALNSRCWFWRSWLAGRADLNVFARSLRIKRNKKLNLLAKVTGVFTTPVFKKAGISGWLLSPDEKECGPNPRLRPPTPLCVTGEVVAKASSTDGLETIDLKVAQIEHCPTDNNICSDRVVLDTDHGFKFSRYIRIENSRAHGRVRVGKTARICGKLRWDTDAEGWWEIHPRDDRDLPPVLKP